MNLVVKTLLPTLAAPLATLASAQPALSPTPPAVPPVLAATQPADWRPLDPENTIYLEVGGARPGRVVLELAPDYAPKHVANVKALAREGYFDGLTINRLQDNYVAQWGDPNLPEKRRAIKSAKATLEAEFDRPIAEPKDSLPFTALPDGDVYAPEVGWSAGFAAARDPKGGRTWLIHCYGALGSARGTDAASGGGTQLFVVIGHSPRHLDRNDTVLGRVVLGIDVLSSLPRGTGPLGVYEKAEERIPIKSLRVAADVPQKERTAIEVLRTGAPAFDRFVESRRNRREEWFKSPTGKVEVCNVPVPTRPVR